MHKAPTVCQALVSRQGSCLLQLQFCMETAQCLGDTLSAVSLGLLFVVRVASLDLLQIDPGVMFLEYLSLCKV